MTVKQRKIVLWLIVIFLLIWLINDPQSLAEAAQTLGRALAAVLAAFRDFVVAIVS
jgi:hypothetical protein